MSKALTLETDTPTSLLVAALQPYIKSIGVSAVHPAPLGSDEIVVTTPPAAPMVVCTVKKVTGKKQEVLDGTNTGLTRTQMQLDFWSKSHNQADRCMQTVRDFLLYETPAGMVVNHQMDGDLYEGNLELHQATTRLNIWFQL